MAENYKFPQQGAGGYYYQHAMQQHQHPRYHVRDPSPPNSARPAYSNHDTPSPSRSQDLHSSLSNFPSMCLPGHQTPQVGRFNGPAGNQRLPIVFDPQHSDAHSDAQSQQPQFSQTQQTMHQGRNGQIINGSGLDDRHNCSVDLSTNTDPTVVSSGLHNGHSTTPRGGQARQTTEHWAEQLRLHKESENAHVVTRNHHNGNYQARTKPDAVHFTDPSPAEDSSTSALRDGAADDQRRPLCLELTNKHQDWMGVDMSGQGFHVLAPQVFHYTFLRELHIASNQIKRLPAAVGQLRLLQYLDISFNQLTELPAELGMCVYLKTMLLFNNRVRSLPSELGSLFNLEMLGIEGNQLDAEVKQEIMERGTKSLVHRFLEQASVPPPPTPRSTLHLAEGRSRIAEQSYLKVFNYNILCDKYANPKHYPYVPSGALDWNYRKELILQEIQTQDADIVCLQEVNADSLAGFFNPSLAHMDYQGVFWPKTRAKVMSAKEAKAVDGCVIYYKSSTYKLLDKRFIDFANLAINRPDMRNQDDIFNRVMPRDDIAVIAFLEDRLTGIRMIVVNAHIFWNPKFADVKLVQVAIMMEAVAALADEYAKRPLSKGIESLKMAGQDNNSKDSNPEDTTSQEPSGGSQMSLLLCGDFNSTPDSSVYELLSTGHVAPNHPELGSYQYGDFTRDGFHHSFSLRSAYSLLDKSPDEMVLTNYTPGFQGVIDHVWYSTNAFEVTSLLGPIDEEYLERTPGFPTYHFPSDHVSLLTEFLVKARKAKTSEVFF